MAGFFQLGDIVVASRLVWSVYKFGWKEEYNASRQYAEFGNDVRGFAESLDKLHHVIRNADSILRSRGGSSLNRLSDTASLNEIIGDYNYTLRRCKDLLDKNKSYRQGTNAVANVEWNILNQPTAEALRQRIMLHNSKVLFLLKPFEIDLLCRIHEDLAMRIDSVHSDLRTLMGVLVPDYQNARAIQERQEAYTLEIDPAIEAEFDRQAQPGQDQGAEANIRLDKSTDAFVYHFERSTVRFQPGMMLIERAPPSYQFLNLLKCIWMMQRIKTSTRLQETSQYSHWPSYIKQLEEELSRECRRFTPNHPNQLLRPELSHLRLDDLSIWPPDNSGEENESSQFREVQNIMVELVNLPLARRSASSPQRFLKLLFDSKNQRYQLIDHDGQLQTNAPSSAARTRDFRLSNTRVVPLYAIPRSDDNAASMMLRNPRFEANFTFADVKSVMKFQQALTGFKPYDFFSQQNAIVSFVKQGEEPLMEYAHLQLWIPKPIKGELAINSDSAQVFAPPTRTQSQVTTSTSARRDSGNATSIGMPRMQSPSLGSWSENGFSSDPFGINYGFGNLALNDHSQSPRSSASYLQPSSASPPRGNFGRIGSVASTYSSATNSRQSSATDDSRRSSEPTVTAISIGGEASLGYMHSKPLKPMLVIFTKSRDGQTISIVSVQIDHDTTVNPERCDCRRHAKSCCITAIERKEGKLNLLAQRHIATGGVTELDLLRLGATTHQETVESEWKSLQRISIKFTNAEERMRFGGTICSCKPRKTNELRRCLSQGHQGVYGEVKEFGRQQLQEWHDAYTNRPSLQRGQAPGSSMSSGPG